MSDYEETIWYQKFQARKARREEREAEERQAALQRRKRFTERQVDRAFVECVKASGGFTTKMHPVTNAGIPDRIFHRRKRTYYVELKATGEQCTPLQIEMHAILHSHGIEVLVLDTKIETIHDLWIVAYTTYPGVHYSKNPHRKVKKE